MLERKISHSSESQEKVGPLLPTRLHLFNFNETQLPAVQTILQEASQIKVENITGLRALDKLEELSITRRNRLYSVLADSSDKLYTLNSSRTAATAYLKMIEEFEPKGFSDQNIFEIFRLCLKINTDLWDRLISLQKGQTDEKRHKIISNLAVKTYQEIIAKEMISKPDWFPGTQLNWMNTIGFYGNFGDFINENHRNMKVGQHFMDRNFDSLFYTLSTGMPDWLVDNPNQVPPREVVERELSEDTASSDHERNQREKIKQQLEILPQNYTKKLSSLRTRLATRFLDTFSMKPGFFELPIALSSTIEVPRFDILFADVLGVRLRTSHEFMPHTQVIENMIDAWGTVEDLGVGRETTALYLEKIMEKSGMIATADTPISPSVMNTLNLFMDHYEESRGERNGPIILNADKKLHYFLNYDFKSMLDLLDSHEVVYLHDLINEFATDPSEHIIWELSDLLVSRLQNPNSKDKNSEIAANVRRNGKSWLKQNWQWACDQMKAATNPDQIAEQPFDENNITEEIIAQVPEVQELKCEQAEELSDWSIYYSTDMTVNPSSLVLIEGETPDDKEDWFKQFVGQQKISSAAPADSILRSVIKLPSEPLTNSNGRPRFMILSVGEENFYVDKHAQERILFKLDPASKKLIFFMHHKRDWEYVLTGSN